MSETQSIPLKKVNLSHELIQKDLNEIWEALPPEENGTPAYLRCRVLYGTMKTFLQKADMSSDPEKVYFEIKKMAKTLREYLQALSPEKSIPKQAVDALDELENTVMRLIVPGREFFEETEEVEPEYYTPLKAKVAAKVQEKVVPESQLNKAQEELARERENVQRLNEENDALNRELERVQVILADFMLSAEIEKPEESEEEWESDSEPEWENDSEPEWPDSVFHAL